MSISKAYLLERLRMEEEAVWRFRLVVAVVVLACLLLLLLV